MNHSKSSPRFCPHPRWVSFQCKPTPGAKEQIDAGNVKAIAVTSRTRVPVLSSVPTIAESGVSNYEGSKWFGILGPKDMDGALVKRINADIRIAMTAPEIVEKLGDRGMFVSVGTPSDIDQLIRAEISKWRPVVTQLGMRGKN